MSEDVAAFYDELAQDYHLIFADWDESIRRQAHVRGRLLEGHSQAVRRVLDGSCGIGTQALGLAGAGYEVTATDISEASVQRCAREAADRGLSLTTGVADLRALDREVAGPFDCAVSFDNALPHLLSDDDLAVACATLHDVLITGGLLCISIRDYDAILARRPTGELPRTYQADSGERIVFQAWTWFGDRYTIRHFLLDERDGRWLGRRTAHDLTGAELMAALEHAGFTDITWRMPEETGFYQPIVTARAAS